MKIEKQLGKFPVLSNSSFKNLNEFDVKYFLQQNFRENCCKSLKTLGKIFGRNINLGNIAVAKILDETLIITYQVIVAPRKTSKNIEFHSCKSLGKNYRLHSASNSYG